MLLIDLFSQTVENIFFDVWTTFQQFWKSGFLFSNKQSYQRHTKNPIKTQTWIISVGITFCVREWAKNKCLKLLSLELLRK